MKTYSKEYTIDVSIIKPWLDRFGIEHGYNILNYYMYYNTEVNNSFTNYKEYLNKHMDQDRYINIVESNYYFFLRYVNKILSLIDICVLNKRNYNNDYPNMDNVIQVLGKGYQVIDNNLYMVSEVCIKDTKCIE